MIEYLNDIPLWLYLYTGFLICLVYFALHIKYERMFNTFWLYYQCKLVYTYENSTIYTRWRIGFKHYIIIYHWKDGVGNPWQIIKKKGN